MLEILSERQPVIELDDGVVGRLVNPTQPQLTNTPRIQSDGCILSVSESAPLSQEDNLDGTFVEAVYERFVSNIMKSDTPAKLSSGTYIPQRPFCQGAAIPTDVRPGIINFEMIGGGGFPAKLAISGQYDRLVDAWYLTSFDSINLRIEWPGYDGWGVQIQFVDDREEPKGITRGKLARGIAKQLGEFIKEMQSVPIHPAFARYRVGKGGIQLQDIHIASLEQVSRGSWQPHFIYVGAQ